jgi:hypothetical protein
MFIVYIKRELYRRRPALLLLPLDQRIMYECVQDTEHCVLVVSQKLHRQLTGDSEDAYEREMNPRMSARGDDQPSTPVTPKPSMIFGVSLKGTRSGVSSCVP